MSTLLTATVCLLGLLGLLRTPAAAVATAAAAGQSPLAPPAAGTSGSDGGRGRTEQWQPREGVSSGGRDSLLYVREQGRSDSAMDALVDFATGEGRCGAHVHPPWAQAPACTHCHCAALCQHAWGTWAGRRWHVMRGACPHAWSPHESRRAADGRSRPWRLSTGS